MADVEQVAQSAYETLGVPENWKDEAGKPLVEWNFLPMDVRNAWRACARASEYAFNSTAEFFAGEDRAVLDAVESIRREIAGDQTPPTA